MENTEDITVAIPPNSVIPPSDVPHEHALDDKNPALANANADAADEPRLSLHAVCGFDRLGLSALTQSLNTHQFGRRSLPVFVPEIDTLPINNNVSIFAICPDNDLNNDIGWRFVSRSAHIEITHHFEHGWDLRSTFRGTLSSGESKVPLGVRIFDHNQNPLRDYLNIAQTNFHVAVSLGIFCQEFLARVPAGDLTEQAYEALLRLRLKEDVVGHMHEPIPSPYGRRVFKAFGGEELVTGPREIYSLDTSFSPISPNTDLHPLTKTIRGLLNAFSHWTYHVSGGESFITGFQGVGPVITESVVHDVTRGNWTHANFGAGAVRRFPQEHVCCKFCVLAGLPPELPVATLISVNSWATSITGWDVCTPPEEDLEGEADLDKSN